MRRIFLRWDRLSVLSLFLGLCARPLFGHDTWILPQRARVAPGTELSLDLTSGMAFPANEVAVKPDRLARASIRLGGKATDLPQGSAAKDSLRIKARVLEPGIAALWVESKPRTLELKPKEVREYLDEIGAWDSIGKKWEAEGSGRWRETYVKHAKTFVRVGEPSGDSSWSEPVGMRLEIVPEKDPTLLVSGSDLPVRVLMDGKPLSDFPLGFVAAGQKTGSFQKTDEKGRAQISFNRQGWWLLRATLLTKSSQPDTDWESHFATLTVFVAGQGRE